MLLSRSCLLSTSSTKLAGTNSSPLPNPTHTLQPRETYNQLLSHLTFATFRTAYYLLRTTHAFRTPSHRANQTNENTSPSLNSLTSIPPCNNA
ncbi:hypothetical protein DL98DRAFT_49352 [Cadophora sp. DSE1049]|nr:hypothetical protein DL98DRAFT_49352 [Cadophora sp. DSE1049]